MSETYKQLYIQIRDYLIMCNYVKPFALYGYQGKVLEKNKQLWKLIKKAADLQIEFEITLEKVAEKAKENICKSNKG